MILRGKDTLLCDTAPASMPSGLSTLNGWLVKIVLEVITTTRNPKTFQVIETAERIESQGVKQPLSKQRLELKPEGERAWEWEELHVDPATPIEPGMYVKIMGKKYRVMACTGYDLNGFLEYELINAVHRPQ